MEDFTYKLNTPAPKETPGSMEDLLKNRLNLAFKETIFNIINNAGSEGLNLGLFAEDLSTKAIEVFNKLENDLQAIQPS